MNEYILGFHAPILISPGKTEKRTTRVEKVDFTPRRLLLLGTGGVGDLSVELLRVEVWLKSEGRLVWKTLLSHVPAADHGALAEPGDFNIPEGPTPMGARVELTLKNGSAVLVTLVGSLIGRGSMPRPAA